MAQNNTEISVSDIDRAPDKMAGVPAVADPKIYDELRASFNEVSEKNIRLQEENDRLVKRVNTALILDSLISPYANRTYWFMVVYCAFVGMILLVSSMAGTDVHVSDDVLKILVGSTAVTVIGLVGMVLTGIFVGARKS